MAIMYSGDEECGDEVTSGLFPEDEPLMCPDCKNPDEACTCPCPDCKAWPCLCRDREQFWDRGID